MRADIEKYLGTVQQSTAKTIASRVGLPQLDVTRELNAMIKDGTLEREMSKGEYAYWLSRGEAPKPAPAASTVECNPVPVLSLPPVVKQEATEPVAEPSFSTDVVEKMRELLSVLGLPPTLARAIDAARQMVEVGRKTATERDELRVENESLKTLAARLKVNNAILEKRIDELTLGPVGAKSPLFVTVGRYAAPKRHASLDKAQKRAALLVRTEKESEVLVLEPVGRVVRGSEWRPQ
ncbi:MAG: 1-pyrroline-5-carboxylate dehydrogenase [Paraburkholderia sp.]|uniref:1-pyrroline-5-carboxylate dehydrogenase n=1 Tax=Paraburkholderia sp. TaxID=1926495 RepID=UPI003C5DC1A4